MVVLVRMRRGRVVFMMKDEVVFVWLWFERDGLELEVSGVFVCEGLDGEE